MFQRGKFWYPTSASTCWSSPPLCHRLSGWFLTQAHARLLGPYFKVGQVGSQPHHGLWAPGCTRGLLPASHCPWAATSITRTWGPPRALPERGLPYATCPMPHHGAEIWCLALPSSLPVTEGTLAVLLPPRLIHLNSEGRHVWCEVPSPNAPPA